MNRSHSSGSSSPTTPPSFAPSSGSANTLSIRPHVQRRGNLLLDLPIVWRLTLGFFVAALIAAVATGIIGLQQTTTLSTQSTFYQNLLRTNTNLTNDASLLPLMTSTLQQMLVEASGPNPSQETLATDQDAVVRLINRYETVLTSYTTNDLLLQNPAEMSILEEGGHSIQGTQQQSLAQSALRSWQVYRPFANQILQDISTGNVLAAQYTESFQAEPTNEDAQSALTSLTQFNENLTTSIVDATGVEEQNQLILTVVGALLAVVAIALVGWAISNTLVHRLRLLLRVTQAVERGEIDARVKMSGRDEIGTVSASMNAMLDAIAQLLVQTREQRDALTNAAEHLFSDIRVVNAGDLRVSAAVSDDPIGLLANAFNFTVSRFRWFLLRTQTLVEQVEVIARQTIERSEDYYLTFRNPEQQHQPENAHRQSAASAHTFHANTLAPKTSRAKAQESAQNIRFAQEVLTVARYLYSLTQEMRPNILAFQFDSPEASDEGSRNTPPARSNSSASRQQRFVP